MNRGLLALMMTAVLLVLPGTVAPVAATPCDHSVYKSMWKDDVFVFARINGEHSYHNSKDDGLSETVSLQYGRSETRGVTKHWEVGASAGFDWKVVKADVSGKYGRSYVDSATTTSSVTRTITIKDGWTGWVRADFYRRVVYWRAYTWRWSDSKGACVKRTIAKAYWGDPKVQYASVKKEGKVYPS